MIRLDSDTTKSGNGRECRSPKTWEDPLLVRRGVPERVAMAMLGWSERATADRYNIVSRGDLEAARAVLDGKRGAGSAESSGKSGPAGAKKQLTR